MSKRVKIGASVGTGLVVAVIGWLRWLLHGIDHGWSISNLHGDDTKR